MSAFTTLQGNRCGVRARAQCGAALVISLVMLTILTILGVASMQEGTMQERMTGNARNAILALQAAEVALRDGEEYVETTPIPGPFDGTNGLYSPADPADPPQWEQIDWSDNNAVRTVSVQGVSADPRYIIEQLSGISFGGTHLAGDEALPAGAVYRITAMGTGLSGEASIMIQSTFRRD